MQKTHLVCGIIAGVLLGTLLILQYVLNISLSHSGFKWGSIVVVILATLLSTYLFSKQKAASLGEIFGVGFRTVAVTIVIFSAIFLIFTSLTPGYKEAFLQELALVQQERNLGEDFETDFDTQQNYFVPSALAGSLLNFFFPGLVTAILAGVFFKKKS
jgi:hypothetical protein